MNPVPDPKRALEPEPFPFWQRFVAMERVVLANGECKTVVADRFEAREQNLKDLEAEIASHTDARETISTAVQFLSEEMSSQIEARETFGKLALDLGLHLETLKKEFDKHVLAITKRMSKLEADHDVINKHVVSFSEDNARIDDRVSNLEDEHNCLHTMLDALSNNKTKLEMHASAAGDSGCGPGSRGRQWVSFTADANGGLGTSTPGFGPAKPPPQHERMPAHDKISFGSTHSDVYSGMGPRPSDQHVPPLFDRMIHNQPRRRLPASKDAGVQPCTEDLDLEMFLLLLWLHQKIQAALDGTKHLLGIFLSQLAVINNNMDMNPTFFHSILPNWHSSPVPPSN